MIVLVAALALGVYGAPGAYRPVPVVVHPPVVQQVSKSVITQRAPVRLSTVPKARTVPPPAPALPKLVVTATCDLITVDAGEPAWVMIRTVAQGVVAPTVDQEQIVDEEGPVVGLSQGQGSYDWEISVTYRDTVEDRHGTVDC